MSDKAKEELINAGLFTLGWLMAKEGLKAMPVAPLARALQSNGCDSTYVRAIVEMADEEAAVKVKKP